MEDTKTRIAHNLDAQFAKMGFTVPGVDVLHESADVSLRTLYKYYPSREAMVEGALEYRNEIYLDWISGGPETGHRHVLHIYERLRVWLVSGPTMAACSLIRWQPIQTSSRYAKRQSITKLRSRGICPPLVEYRPERGYRRSL